MSRGIVYDELTAAMKATLNHHILKTPSGLLHPFYSVTSALRSRGPEMYAKASVHPPLDHETIIPLAQTEVSFSSAMPWPVLSSTKSQN